MPFMDFLIDWGYLGLITAAFLSATLLPLGSEVILVGLLQTELSPLGLVGVATAGNVLGSLTNYALGVWLGKALIAKWLRMTDKDFESAESRFRKYGLSALLLAWVPIIGDPITVIAGILRVSIVWFLILVTLSKLGRYTIIAYFTV